MWIHITILIVLHYGDLTDKIIFIFNFRGKPDEVYNLGAQSHVGVSFVNQNIHLK